MSQYIGSVPDTAARATDWSAHAVCASPAFIDRQDELWFAHSSDRAAISKAKGLCNGCPVRDDCLAEAMAAEGDAGRSNRYGIRGALTPGQRRRRYEDAQARARGEEPKTGRPPAACGTRSGYQRHVRNREPIDEACRRANTEASDRLRRTGTTRVLAS